MSRTIAAASIATTVVAAITLAAPSSSICLTLLPGLFAQSPSSPAPAVRDKGLTAVAGIKVGHHTLTERPTGCTVILTETGAVASVDVRGGAPGTRETDLLNPVNHVQQVNAIVLAGGSAFGLDAATGVMRYLEERGFGYDAGVAKVPIVPAAILFDLPFGGKPKVRPTAECGYAAALAATDGPVAEGSIGAGAGATVGKMGGPTRSMKAGIGTASITMPDGLVVAALVAVNAVGDIIDPATGKVVAGVRAADGKGFADARTLLRSGAFARRPPAAGGPPPADEAPPPGQNTTIGVVATNAVLTKTEATKIAQMAHDGFARTIYPAHTIYDGDTIFALASGAKTGTADINRIGELGAEMISDAILRAVRQAKGIPGYPSAADLSGR
jgi:L-aminopeptidase/D-esterase-like protein